MIGKWSLSNKELFYLREKLIKSTKELDKEKIKIIDLTNSGYSPNQIYDTLIKLGWKEYINENGYENDYWITLEHYGYKNIILYASGMTFEMAIYLEKNKNNVEIKKEHIKNMIN